MENESDEKLSFEKSSNNHLHNPKVQVNRFSSLHRTEGPSKFKTFNRPPIPTLAPTFIQKDSWVSWYLNCSDFLRIKKCALHSLNSVLASKLGNPFRYPHYGKSLEVFWAECRKSLLYKGWIFLNWIYIRNGSGMISQRMDSFQQEMGETFDLQVLLRKLPARQDFWHAIATDPLNRSQPHQILGNLKTSVRKRHYRFQTSHDYTGVQLADENEDTYIDKLYVEVFTSYLFDVLGLQDHQAPLAMQKLGMSLLASGKHVDLQTPHTDLMCVPPGMHFDLQSGTEKSAESLLSHPVSCLCFQERRHSVSEYGLDLMLL